ncbi:TlpA family protein disulfide reductase [Flavobacterium sp.]|jgi:thiol-disulfide isomerase/thioredoxin|uniref:TlpA family protein disulfide reductase n=1 Tax=Flavobacterium sp. TaxID=239 RepID=UPI0037C05FB2
MKILSLLLLLPLLAFSQNSKTYNDTIPAKELNNEELQMKEYINSSYVNDSKKLLGVEFGNIVLEDINAELFISENEKKIIFYNFWSKSCAPCLEEIPMLNALKKKYKNKVEFVAITFDDVEIIKKVEFNFRHFIVDKNEIYKLNFNSGFPISFIISNGKILYYKLGGTTSESPFHNASTKQTFFKFCEIIDNEISKLK